MSEWLHDHDVEETREWLDALVGLMEHAGVERADYILSLLSERFERGAGAPLQHRFPLYNSVNTNSVKMPSDIDQVTKLESWLRWNAMAMVVKACRKHAELGGHIASFASVATLYEVGQNYFFRGDDMVFFQGHSSPGNYARAWLEGRLSTEQLENFRQEVEGPGLSSYPHPWLMPDFWQFPTVSMGLGPLCAIYQARFMRYLEHRNLTPKSDRKVWAFCGDGEMDEPQSLGAIGVAGREHLDNLIFVVNCNLQRLDGPVRGNGSVVHELEQHFRGAGWRVIRVLWNNAWQTLFERDRHGALANALAELPDGQQHQLALNDGAAWRTFFESKPELEVLVRDLDDTFLDQLLPGGHDPKAVFAAYQEAVNTKGHPVVILARTIKGYGMGPIGEGLYTTHQQKKMPTEDLARFAKRFDLPLTKKQLEEVAFVKPAANSSEMTFLKERRKALGGFVPARQSAVKTKLTLPSLQDVFAKMLEGTGERSISTTMAFVQSLSSLLRNPELKPYMVPIIPDEARTFGMEGLFRQLGIYAPEGQLYEPVDRKQVSYYRESSDGQVLEEGLNEEGAVASWMAAGTAYSQYGLPMMPFYIYYSMFGFQRVGDFTWAAADMRTRGFLLGATSGRTTLAGEGLQHQDGHNLVQAGLIPNCVSYDPTYAYELAVILHKGLQAMWVEEQDVYYYITLLNENYQHGAMPKGAEAGIIAGMYRLHAAQKGKTQLSLLGGGSILREVEAARELIFKDHKIVSEVWSVTSFSELSRQARMLGRAQALNIEDAKLAKEKPYVTQCLSEASGPVVAATDYVALHAEQITPWVDRPYHVLGTDGFGRSDTRANLRAHFEVDAKHIAYRALVALYQAGGCDLKVVQKAKKDYKIDDKVLPPWQR